MSKVLELVFKDEKGKAKTISISEPRENVTKTEAVAAMNAVIAAKALQGTSGQLATIGEDPRMRTTTVEPLA